MPSKAPNAALQMLAKNAGRMEQDLSTYEDDDTREQFLDGNAPRVAHSRPGRVHIYFLTPSGVQRREVSVQSLGGPDGVLANGGSPTCFDCGRDDCGEGINDCTGRPPRMYRRCPVPDCNDGRPKLIYDPRPTGQYVKVGVAEDAKRREDPNEIEGDQFDLSTPESRTRAALERHILGFHSHEAHDMGIRGPREVVPA